MAVTIANELKSIRNSLAELYKRKVLDAEPDKGELTQIHTAIISIEKAVQLLSQEKNPKANVVAF